MSDTASIRLPRTAPVRTRPATAARAARSARPATSPRAAYAAGTYVVVDAEYADRPAGTFTGAPVAGRADGTFVSVDALGARGAGSYVD